MAELRTVTVDQADILAELSARTFLEAYEGLHGRENALQYCKEHYTAAAYREALSNPSTECVIAWHEGAPVGFYMLRHQGCDYAVIEGNTSELYRIYIRKSHFGTGLGKQLYEDAVARIRAHGSESLWLCVADINERARLFYEKLGFIPLAVGPILPVGTERLSSTIMMKPL